MDFTTLDWGWYVPVLDGNRARYLAGEEPNPLMVELKTPAYGYIRTLSERRAGAPPDKRASIDQTYFVDHVRGVRALILDGHAVTTGVDLWRRGVEENRMAAYLFLELFQALDSQATLQHGLAQGLSGPSGSV